MDELPTTGKEVAQVLMEVSQGYAILGDKRRAMAYENAATGLTEWCEEKDVSVMTMAALQKVPMIGKSTATSIKEITKNGTCSRLKGIRAKGLPSMAELLSLPGLGPATARTLWADHNITTKKMLERALRNGDIYSQALHKKLVYAVANAPRTAIIAPTEEQDETVSPEVAARFASIILPEQQ